MALVAQGLTSRDIGGNLFLSPRTVEMHVQNSLDKLGCRTRAEAVRRLTERGRLVRDGRPRSLTPQVCSVMCQPSPPRLWSNDFTQSHATRGWPEGEIMPDPADEAAASPARPRGIAQARSGRWSTRRTSSRSPWAWCSSGWPRSWWWTGSPPSSRRAQRPAQFESAATALFDQVLLVLILVEIVHTVVLSLRAHRLAAQPFIIVGLVAVIRRILFVLSSEVKVNTTELGLLIVMLVAFVASFIAVSWFERRDD